MKIQELTETLEKILKHVSRPIVELNDTIEVIEKGVKEDIETITTVASGLNITDFRINKESEIAKRIKEKTGIYIKPSSSDFFGCYTAKINPKKPFLLLNSVRNCVFDFIELKNSKINKDFIKTKYNFQEEENKVIFFNTFKNGQQKYKRTPELEKVIVLAQKIEEILQNKNI